MCLTGRIRRMSDSGELSDGLDEFEASGEEQRKTKASNVSNKPYDEAYEISADLSMAESFDGREAKVCVVRWRPWWRARWPIPSLDRKILNPPTNFGLFSPFILPLMMFSGAGWICSKGT